LENQMTNAAYTSRPAPGLLPLRPTCDGRRRVHWTWARRLHVSLPPCAWNDRYRHGFSSIEIRLSNKRRAPNPAINLPVSQNLRCKYWICHVRFGGVGMELERGLRQVTSVKRRRVGRAFFPRSWRRARRVRAFIYSKVPLFHLVRPSGFASLWLGGGLRLGSKGWDVGCLIAKVKIGPPNCCHMPGRSLAGRAQERVRGRVLSRYCLAAPERWIHSKGGVFVNTPIAEGRVLVTVREYDNPL